MNTVNSVAEFLVQHAPDITIWILFVALVVNAYAGFFFIKRVKESECEIDRLRSERQSRLDDCQERIDVLYADYLRRLELEAQRSRDVKLLLNQRIESVTQDNLNLYGRNTALANEVIALTDRLVRIETETLALYRRQWLEYLRGASFTAIEEVAYKFALPLLVFLGYDLDSIKIGQFKRIIGSLPHAKTSDWVISGERTNQPRKKLFLVEIVDTPERLTDDFLEQSGIIAHEAHVYKYVVTNGHDFHLCTRHAPYDITVTTCRVKDLEKEWSTIETELSFDRLMPGSP